MAAPSGLCFPRCSGEIPHSSPSARLSCSGRHLHWQVSRRPDQRSRLFRRKRAAIPLVILATYPQWARYRPLPPLAPTYSRCMTSAGPHAATPPTAHPQGTGVAATGTRSHARGSQFPVRGASPLQPAMHDPSGLQANPPLIRSPRR